MNANEMMSVLNKTKGNVQEEKSLISSVMSVVFLLLSAFVF